MRNDDPGLDDRGLALPFAPRASWRHAGRDGTVDPPYATRETAGEVPGKSSAFVRI
jgi:hypothetical protein